MKKILLFLSLSLLPLTSLPAQQKAAPPVLDQAVAKFRAGDLQGAIALLEPLKGKPGSPPAALSLLGALYLQVDRPKDALALLGPLADTEAAGPVILDNAGRAALALGQTEKGERYLERAVAKAPVSPAARELGLHYGRQGKPVDSYRLLRPWALAYPQDQDARLAAAFCALELDRPSEAAELLNGLPDDNPRTRLLRGKLLFLQGDPRAAIATLTPLLNSGPQSLDRDARRFLAEAHAAVGESEQAVALLQGKVDGDSNLTLLLAKAQYQAGSPADSAATLAPVADSVLAKEPTSLGERGLAADVALEYGRALIGITKWPEAVAALEKAAAYDPDNPQAWQLLGQAQLAAGRRDDATRSLTKFREVQSAEKGHTDMVDERERGREDPTGRNLSRAAKLASEGRTADAFTLLDQEARIASSDPRVLKALQDLAAQLLTANQKEEARTVLQRILAIKPDDPRAAEELRKLGSG